MMGMGCPLNRRTLSFSKGREQIGWIHILKGELWCLSSLSWCSRPGGLPESCCLQSVWNPEEATLTGQMDLPARVRASRQGPSFLVYICVSGLPPEGAPRFKVALPVSNSLVQKSFHWSTQKLGGELVPDAVKLTTKISHHKNGGHADLAEFLTVWTLERMAVVGYSIQN